MTTFRTTGPTISEAVVLEIEHRIGSDLPTDYRDFLLKTNGGTPEDAYVPEPADIGIVVTGFFSLGEASGDLSMESALSTWANRYPDGYLPIARCEGSNLLLLGVSRDVRDLVFYWDHDGEADDNEPPRTDNLTFVASSFTELIDSLTDDEADDEEVRRLLDGSTGWVNPGFKPRFS